MKIRRWPSRCKNLWRTARRGAVQRGRNSRPVFLSSGCCCITRRLGSSGAATRAGRRRSTSVLGKSPGADLNRSAILASIAYCMIHAGDNAGAAAMATRAVETDPTNYSGWYRRATARLNCGGDFAVMSGAGAWQLQRFLVCYDRLGVLDREDAKELAARPSDPQEGADAAGDVRLEHRLLGSGDVHGCSAAGSSPGHEPEDPRRAASGSATWLAAAGNEEDVGCRLRGGRIRHCAICVRGLCRWRSRHSKPVG